MAKTDRKTKVEQDKTNVVNHGIECGSGINGMSSKCSGAKVGHRTVKLKFLVRKPLRNELGNDNDDT